MEIVKIKINNLKPYKNNAKKHPKEQIEQIKKSIQEFGMNDPIAVWGKDNLIVEGHGRLEALKELGYKEVECIRLDHLTDEERKAYTLAHNKLTMNSDFDFEVLDNELNNILNIDMSDFGFVQYDIDWNNVEDLKEETYEEPVYKMLQCPKCHHIDRDIHFKKINSDEVKKIKLDNYSVETATIEDIEQIKKIADKNTQEIGFVLRPALEENSKKGCLLVAKTKENEVVGFCNYNARKDGVNVIYEICTDYKYRGNGIGKSLISAVKKPIQLKCPEDNESNKFYEHYGFKLIDVENGKKRKLNVWRLE